MTRIIYALVFFCLMVPAFAWNAAGHKVVAQIAFDNLSPSAKEMCHKYLRSRRHNTPNASFVSAATWMDEIRFRGIYWYDLMHYIDIPFSTDATPLPPVEHTNAVWAMKQALDVFSSKKTTPAEKRIALRMLIHITGDIHQPLHAVTRVSAELPRGDLGGNLFFLGANSVGNNLHKYWDNGAGLFLGGYNGKKVQETAYDLERKYPCSRLPTSSQPKQWAKMSHNLALKNAYQFNPKQNPGIKYQKNAQMLVQKQVAFAGCRLAVLLNKVAKAA